MTKHDALAHERYMQTWLGKAEMAGWWTLTILGLPILAALVLWLAVTDPIKAYFYRKKHGYCVHCGHKHDQPLTIQTDAHGWKPEKVCPG